jgi:hypothetical protein
MDTNDGAASLVRSDALLACPFCGRQVHMHRCAMCYEIRCEPCDLIFPVHGSMDKAELAKAWNTRHANSPICVTTHSSVSEERA